MAPIREESEVSQSVQEVEISPEKTARDHLLKFIDQEELNKLGVEQKEQIEDDDTLTDL